MNFERRKHGKLERFHATHCNGGSGDYEGWEKADRVGHTKALLEIVKRRKNELAAVCAGLDVEAMLRVYPDEAKDWLAGAYRLTVTQLMIMVGRKIKKNSGCQVAIIHDWANEYNAVISDAFTSLRDNPQWVHRNLFISCVPMKWQDRIALQSADMIAFDTFKLLDGTIHSTPKMRRSLQALLDGQIPIVARYIGEPALLRLRQLRSESTVAHRLAEALVGTRPTTKNIDPSA